MVLGSEGSVRIKPKRANSLYQGFTDYKSYSLAKDTFINEQALKSEQQNFKEAVR